ncbi:MAG: hypothetical protein HZA52_02825 [Planctomycetes bacterium]|nr:hypothetical protein [Planctomycetota bacterium]
MSIRSLLATLVCVCSAQLAAHAQLELPKTPVGATAKPAGQNLPEGKLPEERRGNLAGRLAGELDGRGAERSGQELDLPAPGSRPPPAVRRAPDPAPEPSAAPAAASSIAPVGAPLSTDAPRGAAGFVLTELRKVRDVDHRLVDQASQSLIQLGADGRAAGRYALASDHGPTIVAGARVLLAGGDERDFELVVARIKSKLAPAVSSGLVRGLIDIDPVRASPRLMCELLGHAQGTVRAAAYKQLSAHLSEDTLPYLRFALGCEQSDGRYRAVDLVAAIPGEQSTMLLLERLKDRSAQVAYRAATALALRDDPNLDGELLGRAFKLQWVLREGEYALVTLLEREDTRLRPILGPAHVEALLAGLERGDSFVSGVCAAALAGIGFRADEGAPTPWLDREVPMRLLRVVSGQEFSNDYSAVLGVASRRLALISGEDFGSNGPAWLDWWATHGKEFRAARAALSIGEADVGRIELAVRSTAGRAEAFTLVGPDAAAAALASAHAGEVLVLAPSEAQSLVELARREGLLSSERLPGTRGRADGAARSLELGVGKSSKLFRFAGDAAEPWFQRVWDAAAALREHNAWQRYRDTGRFATQLEWWSADRGWWEASHSELERKLRLKACVLAALATVPLAERDRPVRELEALYADDAVVDANDFAALAARIGDENAANDRAKRLIGLATRAARSLGGPAAFLAPESGVGAGVESGVESAPIDATLANELALVIAKSLGTSGAGYIARVLAASGRDNVRAAAASETPLLRVVAAGELARAATDEQRAADWPVLEKLLADPVPPVQIATVLALGENKFEPARTSILLLARMAEGTLRAAALEAAGRLGGEGAFDALMIALSDGDEALEVAAARGLASLADPETAPLFTSLMVMGPTSPLYTPARDGLMRLGAAAHDELLRAARGTGSARREAALLLGEQNVPESAPLLMTLFTESPQDGKVASELCILTCVDLRGDADPAGAWWDWWDTVVHDDAVAWLRQGAERVHVAPPTAEALGRTGTREGLEFLCALAARAEPHLAERARRELGKLAGRDIGMLPVVGPERDAWLAALRETLAPRFP